MREVLQYYRQFDNPLAQFRENQRKLYEQMNTESSVAAKQAPVKRWAPSFLSHK